MPLFARFQVEGYLGGMFNPVVQLKSGGYIVIGVTEALVAIDVNSGRATKEGSIEETATKTNLEACDEVARQLRLRDLAGLIVIDFIDMDERKNNAAVEKRLKDKLKTDRARIQVGKISGFGLMEMSRQRLRPGMLESTTQPCAHCHGTGLIRSDDSLALTILRAIEEEGTRKRSREVLVKAPIAVANFLMNAKREHIAMIESRYGMSVRVEADPTLISPDYAIEKFKTATRLVPEVAAPVLTVDATLMAQIDEDETVVEEAEDAELLIDREIEADEAADARGEDDADGEGRSKRRRRRRRRGGKDRADGRDNGNADEDEAEAEGEAPVTVKAVEAEGTETDDAAEAEQPKSRSRSRSRSRRKPVDAAAAEEIADPQAADVLLETEAGPVAVDAADQDAVLADAAAAAGEQADVQAEDAAAVAEAAEVAPEPEVAPEVAPAPEATVAPEAAPVPEATPAPAAEAVTETVAEEAPARPKRRGWWSIG